LIAVVHLMLILIYRVLETRQSFLDRKAPPLSDPQRQRMIRHHIRRLGKLGIAIHPTTFVPVQPTTSTE
jgi:hypothetical protein